MDNLMIVYRALAPHPIMMLSAAGLVLGLWVRSAARLAWRSL